MSSICTTSTKAAMNGRLDCLRYTHEKGCPWDEGTCAYAAENGHLDCLQYAHENGCDWNRWTCVEAAAHGHLDCLQYAHENGCDWNLWTCLYAAENGHLDCLQYAQERQCPWADTVCTVLFDGCSYYADSQSKWSNNTTNPCGQCAKWLNIHQPTIQAILDSTVFPADIARLIGDFTCEVKIQSL